MRDDSPLGRELLGRLKARRNDIRTFTRTMRPRARRLTNLSVVTTSIAAVLTAGPGLGGTSFSDAVQRIFSLTTSSIVWQVLCLLATLISIGSAVLIKMDRSKDISSQLTTAEMCAGELEWLQMMVEYGELPTQEAAKLYQHYTSKITFIDESDPVSSIDTTPPVQQTHPPTA